MTGNLGGTNHSALARSNERLARQERNAAAIDQPARVKFVITFSGVLKTFRCDEKLEELPGGVYRVTLRRSYLTSSLHLLEEAKAVILSRKDNTTTVVIEFAQHAPVVDTRTAECAVCGKSSCDCITVEDVTICPTCNWLPDEILMLPAHATCGTPVVKFSEKRCAPKLTGKKKARFDRRCNARLNAKRIEINGFIELPKGHSAIMLPGYAMTAEEAARWHRVQVARQAGQHPIDPDAILKTGVENAIAAKANTKHTHSTGQRYNGRTVLGSV